MIIYEDVWSFMIIYDWVVGTNADDVMFRCDYIILHYDGTCCE